MADDQEEFELFVIDCFNSTVRNCRELGCFAVSAEVPGAVRTTVRYIFPFFFLVAVLVTLLLISKCGSDACGLKFFPFGGSNETDTVPAPGLCAGNGSVSFSTDGCDDAPICVKDVVKCMVYCAQEIIPTAAREICDAANNFTRGS